MQESPKTSSISLFLPRRATAAHSNNTLSDMILFYQILSIYVTNQQIDPAMSQELPVMQLSYVLIGTIVWWLESEKRYTPRQMATWFWRFAFYGYLAARWYQAPQ